VDVNIIQPVHESTSRAKNYLTIMVDTYRHVDHTYTLDQNLRKSGISTCVHSLLETVEGYDKEKDLKNCIGIIFLIHHFDTKIRKETKKLWTFARKNEKRVYVCFIKDRQGVPEEFVQTGDVPTFSLTNELSMHHLVYFIHLHQRKTFLDDNVTNLQEKLLTAEEQLKKNAEEVANLKKRYHL